MSKQFARAAVVGVILAALGCNSTTPTPLRPAGDDFDARAALTRLASDEMEGRGLGTAGLDRAAELIADEFRAAGVRPPPGKRSYFQNFEITSAVEVGAKTSLRVGDREFRAKRDFTPVGFSSEGDFSGPVVFAGYGINSEEHDYNDFAGVDVKGKVALVLRYEPHNAEGKSRFADDGWSAEAALTEKTRAARDAGALALLLVNPPMHHDEDDLVRISRHRGEPILPMLHVKRTVADEILRRADAPSLKTLQKEIDDSGKPASMPLDGVRVAGNIDLDRQHAQLKNIIGYVPGVKRDEYVVVGAHYDHLGRGQMLPGRGRLAATRRGDDIYNGADDNASGATALLTLASRIARSGTPPRSMLFVAFTAEEEGLIGSAKFVDDPPVPLSRIVAMLNLDMVGRIRTTASATSFHHPAATQATAHGSATRPAATRHAATQPATTQDAGAGILYVGGTGTAPSFEKFIDRADSRSPLVTRNMGKGGTGPSDHMSFALKRIPVLFFFSGLHGDYHRPTDDADKINYQGLDHVVDLVHDVAMQVATMPREEYVSASDAAPMRIGASSGSRVTLGVVPDYAVFEQTGGVRISGTTPGSPAAAAGLRDGDVITQFDKRKMETLYDLTDALARSRPGQKVKLQILRDGKHIEVEATLAERK